LSAKIKGREKEEKIKGREGEENDG